MDLKNRKLQKYVSLSIGILAYFMLGIVFTFNAYAIALKHAFNYTQTELEYIASSGDLGFCFSFPAGIVFDLFGPRVSCIISLVLTALGFGLMSTATNFRIFFTSKSWLFCAFYFMASVGTQFIYTASGVVNCKNFDRKHTGKILGLLQAVFGISPAIFSALYGGLFVQGHIEDAENQKLAEFLLMLAVLSVCINTFGVVMLETLPEVTAAYDIGQLELIDTNENKIAERNTLQNVTLYNRSDEMNETTPIAGKKISNQPIVEEMKWWQISKTPQFYSILFICIITGGTGGTLTNNITTLVKSAQVHINAIAFTVTIPILASIGRLIGGAVQDYISQKWPDIPKSSTLLFPVTLTCISQIVLVFFNQCFAGLMSASAMAVMAFAFFYVQVYTITVDLFGMKYFAQNTGLMTVGHAVGMVLFQKLFALNYETYSPPGSQTCYGELCTQWFFVLTSILCFFAIVLNFCLMKIERDKRLQYEEESQDS
ncbi:unnamed protein product [Owenia fusiformis]|uniref:Uncharacterized protein n=1 Tax=Owenia fusiformis TaxID=6347 RepID=A0A8J1XXC3_OWEFU|nr:unnamed protein product [Owenia fusiformis]